MNSIAAKNLSLAEHVVVTAEQMQRTEGALFAAGMPVSALMEKVAGRIADWIARQYPVDRTPTLGFIIGPGHNGGDALVVARELHHQGYRVLPWCPFLRLKELTANHKRYLEYLGIAFAASGLDLCDCDAIVDGGFGFGLARPLEGEMAEVIESINQWPIPIISIDVPSGIDTDTGAVLGVAIRARHTLCLGLWKLGLLQDAALPWVGQAHLIPFDIPASSLRTGLQDSPQLKRLSTAAACPHLPLPRPVLAHKYTAGHALVIAGSRQYMGAALLAGKGAIASGVGMLTMVVPESLKLTVVSQLPEALVLGASEAADGAIAALPPSLTWEKYDVVACGPGLTVQADTLMAEVFECCCPLVLDADGLNWLAQRSPINSLQQRTYPTLLTPHLGEFRRLFPDLLAQTSTPTAAAQKAAQCADCTIVLKGAISAIAHPDGQIWFNPNSTPALARGGSGDVLTGLVAGLAAQHVKGNLPLEQVFLSAAIAGVWWHAQAGCDLVMERSLLGCAPSQLAKYLPLALAKHIGDFASERIHTST
ncbi:MAG: NAD(P)H-hydrate dehydratase [Cyanobacteria bacterium J06639_14]